MHAHTLGRLVAHEECFVPHGAIRCLPVGSRNCGRFQLNLGVQVMQPAGDTPTAGLNQSGA